MIAVEALSAVRDGTPVLTDVTFTVDPGETVAVMGANGAGKTTLLKHVAGLREPATGTVSVDGTVGFAPEDPRAGLFADTVADEVAFFPRNRGLDVDARRDAAMAALDVTALRDRDPYSLSVGEQRRVSIAAVLAGDPDVLVLDEPTRGLDAGGEAHLAERLGALDTTILLSTHAADFAYGLADRVAVLKDGAFHELGAAEAVLTDPDLLESAGIRPPGLVRWAREAGIDPPPRSLEDAIRVLEAPP